MSSSQWATRVQLVRQGRGQRRTHTSESPCPSGAGVFVPLLRQHPGERPWGWGALSTPGPTCLEVGVGDLQQEDQQWSASTWTDVLRSGKGQGQGQSTDDISYSQEASSTQISCQLLTLVCYQWGLPPGWRGHRYHTGKKLSNQMTVTPTPPGVPHWARWGFWKSREVHGAERRLQVVKTISGPGGQKDHFPQESPKL